MVKIKKKIISFNTWPTFTEKEIKVANKVIASGKVNYWTGIYCKKFELNFKKKFGLKHTISVANGSLALDAAVNVLNLKKNDEVIVTPRSYVSSASCVQKTSAKIRFVDVDLNTQNISIDEIKKNINSNTRLIICVHLAGWPCDIEKIKKIIGKRNIRIIEDCSQAHGAMINGKYAGSMGDISVWSFCNDKIISTLGEGGMISCKSDNLFKKIWAYKDCGKNLDKVLKKNKNNLFKWIHDFDGTNLRMTEIQAAVGNVQLEMLDNMIRKRSKNSSLIWKNILKSENIFAPIIPKNILHAGYRCYLFAKNKNTRNRFITHLNKNGIDANQGSCPEIYREKRFSRYNNYKVLKNAKKLGDISVSLPSHHLIDKKGINFLINQINKFIIKNDNQ